jgi:hypothetical protein
MAKKARVKRWTFSGIKAYFPNLSYSDWLGICRRGDNVWQDRYAVVSQVHGRIFW